MAKDYFQDIMPPTGDPDSHEREASIHVDDSNEPPPIKGIRNISPPTRLRPTPRPVQGPPISESEVAPRRLARLWIWAAAALTFLFIVVIALLMFRSTTVTVTPKSHTIILTDAIPLSAYPAPSMASETLSYSVKTLDLEDSEVVPAQGTVHVEKKASGSITVFNEYSASSVRLIKNTRFESPEGLVFRTPADIVIPGKGASPGLIKVTVIADRAGEKYNIGPVARFTLPGLKSGDMFTKVYAQSTSPMQGGIVGEEPGTAPGALNTAIAVVRSRLEMKARESALGEVTPETFAFPELMQITYQSLPNTAEAGTGVRIHERASVEIPVFPADTFALAVAQSAAADADNVSLSLVPGDNFTARIASTSLPLLGRDPLRFALSGKAMLVWNVDGAALAAALAGRDSGAFQTIVNSFPGVQEAHAKIEPFWKKTFPAQASDIKVSITKP